ncbi:hypothetical protein GCM10008967_31360 [Bacillus carboniphilus]|uniref:Medium/long-chain acyl-CoA thioesterase YigI n=1 Tax=Bacillus carboniphilus TaxID=86663 RepID=A0ABP3G7R8_9BACI
MKEKLQQEWASFIEEATTEEQEILRLFLNGIKRKKSGMNESYISSFLQIEKNTVADGLEMTFPITPFALNSLDIVHGGVTATVLDTVMGTYAHMLISKDRAAVTSEMNLHFLAKGVGEKIYSKATLIHKGNTRLVMEAKAYREDGTLMAHATGTFHIIPRPEK